MIIKSNKRKNPRKQEQLEHMEHMEHMEQSERPGSPGSPGRRLVQVIFLGLLLIAASAGPVLYGENVIIPGDVSRLCYYSNFFYNFPSEDFLYYLNDRLLFWEKPDDLIVPNGLREKLLQVVGWHKILKKSVQSHSQEKKNQVAFKLIDPDEYQEASQLLFLLGHKLEKNDKGQYYLIPVEGAPTAGYLSFSLINPQALEQQLNQTHTLFFHIKESEVPLPQDLDLAFIGEISDLKLTSASFFEHMLKNERLSLLMAVLYRLSKTEIQYIKSLNAWKNIYQDKKLLMGFFVLSNALRVKQDEKGQFRLLLPGGAAAESFWSQMAGQVKPSTFEFLERLAAKDDGKLNYLYIFSYFLPEETRKAMFFDYDAEKVLQIYQRIALKEEEKLNASAFPALNDWSYFLLGYALKTKEGRLDLPQGVDAWIKAVKGDETASSDSLFDLMTTLVEDKGDVSGKMSALRKFMAIYRKFSHRPGFLDKGVLFKLYNNYEKYNGLVDFMEKIPLKKPGTAMKLFTWVQALEALGSEDQLLLTTIYQSLFEILSFTAKYSPDQYDYDLLVSELTDLPLSRPLFFQGLFRFFIDKLNIRPRGLHLTHVMLRGIPNPTVTIGESKYQFLIKDFSQKAINKILQSQEVCSFANLLEINRLLEETLTTKPPNTGYLGNQLKEAFLQLPHPGISGDAPKTMRDRVLPYNPDRMNKDAQSLIDMMHMGEKESNLEAAAAKLKGDYLIYQLRDHLLALAYAINAKDPDLKAFINPNFARLHDIAGCGGYTSWDNECGSKLKKRLQLSEYYLTGGLSRLNLSFASRWQEHLFGGNILLNSPHVQAVIANLLELYPYPQVEQGLTYQALLVELGLGVLRESVESENQTIKPEVAGVLQSVISGYHYRQAMAYIDGESELHSLYFSELRRIGEAVFKNLPGKEYLERIHAWKELEPFRKPPLSEELIAEKNRFGNIYSHTFGNLVPQDINIFPQEMSILLTSGWLGGSMLDEFKMKLAYHMYKKQIPPSLLGQLLNIYLERTGGRFLRQNHIHDYPITYFIFDIFNTSHLNRLITELKKEGYLQLK